MKLTEYLAALAAILLLTFTLAGCKSEVPEQSAPPSPAAPAAETRKKAASPVELKFSPDPPVALKDTKFTVKVTYGEGVPVKGATVVLDLSMPGMYHGENRPALTETAPGVYEGKGILTMGGGWLAKVEATAGGATVATGEFRFSAVDK